MTVYRLGLFPVTEAVLDQIPLQGLDPSSVDLFIVQHLLDDTSAFLGLLQRKGYCIRSVLGVEYSSRAHVTASLLSAGIDVLVPPLAELEGVASNQLARALEPGSGGKPVIVHEVGGWCAPFLHNAGSRAKSRLVGVVEETKRGLWRYQGLGDLDFRVVQIADSELKKIEAGLVGDAVARVIEADCLELGECLPGTPVGVLGFGDIGSAVASSLAARRCLVSCYDPNPIRAIEARMRGLARAGRDEILGRARIIVGASGAASLKFADLHRTPDGVLLYSASSRDVEFPVGEIVSSAQPKTPLEFD